MAMAKTPMPYGHKLGKYKRVYVEKGYELVSVKVPANIFHVFLKAIYKCPRKSK